MKATVTCPYCLQQHEVEPAKLLGMAKKTVTPAVVAANKARSRKRWGKGEK